MKKINWSPIKLGAISISCTYFIAYLLHIDVKEWYTFPTILIMIFIAGITAVGAVHKFIARGFSNE